MQASTIRFFAAVLLTLYVGVAGCASLSQQDSGPQALLKPLGGERAQLDAAEPQSESELCLTTARAVATRGHATEAIKLFEKAEQLDASLQLDLELAPLYAQVGNFESSIERYQHAIAQGAQDQATWNNLAWTLIEAGKFTAARAAIEQGLSQHPTDERLSATLAVLQYKTGHPEDALASFHKLYGEAAAHHNLAVLHLEHGDVPNATLHAELATQAAECPPEAFAFQSAIQRHTPN